MWVCGRREAPLPYSPRESRGGARRGRPLSPSSARNGQRGPRTALGASQTHKQPMPQTNINSTPRKMGAWANTALPGSRREGRKRMGAHLVGTSCDRSRRTRRASEAATSDNTDARDGELLSRPSGDRAPASDRELARPAVDTHTNEFGDTKCNSLAIDAITTNSSGCVTRRRACEGCDTRHAAAASCVPGLLLPAGLPRLAALYAAARGDRSTPWIRRLTVWGAGPAGVCPGRPQRVIYYSATDGSDE